MEAQGHHGNAVQAEPELLYHYTTQRGLLGILHERCIWASHIRYLNDASEFKHGLQMVSQSILKIKIDPSTIQSKRIGANDPFPAPEIEGMLQTSANGILTMLDFIDVFVASFFGSEGTENDAGDVLAQWRAYSGNGTGISIGFDKRLLSDHLTKIGSGPELWIPFGSCLYGKDQQENYLDSINQIGPLFIKRVNTMDIDFCAKTMSKLFGEFGSGSQTITKDDYSRAWRQAIDESEGYVKQQGAKYERDMMPILNELMALTAFMKHPAFEQENEWRLARFLFGSREGVKFREGTSSLVPYVCIPLPIMDSDHGLIRRIVVGPSPKLEDAVDAVRMLIGSRGLKLKSGNESDGIEVSPSNIPHRPW